MNIKELTSTQIAIIALIKANDISGQEFVQIPGRTHLIKEIFAIKKTDLGNRLLDELDFESDNFGPFDETIFAALDELEDAGIVRLIAMANGSKKIELSEEGKSLANNIWKKLRSDVKAIITYAKVNFNHLSPDKLLDKIYSAYPEMAKYSLSKVATKYRH